MLKLNSILLPKAFTCISIKIGWKVQGTTLGADNSIGVATILALLDSDKLSHPSLEVLFTVDEESGMGGAQGLDAKMLSGNILLNLDSEKDDELTVGCAGGIETTISGSYKMKNIRKNQDLRFV
ncbi:hypothetical protein [Bacteroidetes bacterium endosymbiont of Geopemphigus sp.]|uniref:hypothetical protein n=1 Tax=Bacteroidetes bacterium endosymbiont of Geopemphigus sp. TaxID=2047937 RepID=UPI000CD0024C|nr:hypothetical protein [Bacteroidetes bacterium endosymbiont of Geopemphigus sp.]